jgi:hypothetical protein
MLASSGVAYKGSRGDDQHVHQPPLPRVRGARLRVRPHRVRPGADPFHHPPTPQGAPLPGLRVAGGPAPRDGRETVPHPAHRLQARVRQLRRPAGLLPGLRGDPPGRRRLRGPAAELHQGVRAVRPGVVAAHDHPRRGPPPRCELGRHQGHPEARPGAPLRPPQARRAEADRHRRDRRGQGPPLPDRRARPGDRGGGVRRRRQGRGRPEALLEAAPAGQGPGSRRWPWTCPRPTGRRSRPTSGVR